MEFLAVLLVLVVAVWSIIAEHGNANSGTPDEETQKRYDEYFADLERMRKR